MAAKNDTSFQRYKEWDDVCYKQYTELFPEEKHTTIWDGVISPKDYVDNVFKIMFLNREGYTEEGNSYCVNKELRETIERDEKIFPSQTLLRTHLKQYLAILSMVGINDLLDISDDEARIKVEEFNDESIFNLWMKDVAYCNIKKSDGKTNSNINDLREYAKKGLEIIKEQIRFFNPSIILAGNVCDGILEDLVEWGENLYIGHNRRICIWQLKIDDKLYPFVDMYHPSYASGMSEYYLDLLHALQAVEKEHPGFWVEHFNHDCFQSSKFLQANPQIMSIETLHDKPEPAKHTNDGERFYQEGKYAAEELGDWILAVRYYQKAAKLNNADAYRALADFCENIYYEKKIYKESGMEFFNDNENYYYEKAAELGDKYSQLRYVDKYIWENVKVIRCLSVLEETLNLFKMKKVSTDIQEKADKAVKYFNDLLLSGYQPAIDMLRDLQKSAEDNIGKARELLTYIDIPTYLK